MVSELVTNAVVHAGDDEALHLLIRSDPDGNLYIAVSDGSLDPPELRGLTWEAEVGMDSRSSNSSVSNGGRNRRRWRKRVWVELT